MTDISSNVERIIEKLDDMTTEIVPKTYGTDIASKVEHIAKQLDYVQAGGGSGGGSSIMFVNFIVDYDNQTVTADKTYAEIYEHIDNGGAIVGKTDDLECFYQFAGIVNTDTGDAKRCAEFYCLHTTRTSGTNKTTYFFIRIVEDDSVYIRIYQQ